MGSPRRVLIIYTGGTIGMRRTARGFAPEPGQLARAMGAMPHFQDPKCEPRVTPMSPYGHRIAYDILEDDPLMDSSNMDMDDWVRIANQVAQHYDQYDGFVILHGTDTMSYTASALSFMLVNLSKTVVMTGSQIPLTDQRNDGLDNLLGAMTIAAHFIIPEVCLYFHHTLYRGNRTQKVDAKGLAAFESGNYPALAEAGTTIDIQWHRVRRATTAALRIRTITQPHVGCLRIFPGITRPLVENFLRDPIRGVIIETFGAGNGPDNRPDLLEVFTEANNRGVILVNCTQCHRGSVYSAYAAGTAMADAGLVSGMDMTPEAALTKLAYLLSQDDLTPQLVKRLMGTNLRGELTEFDTNQSFSAMKPTQAELDARTDEAGEFQVPPMAPKR